jgi:arylsulfatase A-like enzyme
MGGTGPWWILEQVPEADRSWQEPSLPQKIKMSNLHNLFRWGIIGSACLEALIPFSVYGGAPSIEERPNVIVIISDDQGWADIGYNNPKVYTPHLDRLANAGAKLTSHYVMPQCTPTRVALMTGRYPGRFGTAGLAANNKPSFPLGTPTLAKMFQDCGYETFMSGKWHLGSTPEHGPNHFGFDQSHGSLTGAVGMYDHRYHAKADTPYDPTWHRNHEIIPGYQNSRHVTDLTSEEAVKFINRERDQPFFLYLPFHAPHTPLDERGQFVDSPTQPDPKNPQRWLNEDKIKWFNDPKGIIQAEESRDKRLLLATVHHLDSAIGEVLNALNKSGQRKNTIILFSSDNGPWMNNGGGGYPDNYPLKDYNQPDNLRGKKLDVWEGGIHVAGFINWPDRIKAREVSEHVHIIDWFPTLASMINFRPAKKLDWDGVDLCPLLFRQQSLPERDLYWIWHPTVNRWALSHKQWKIVKYNRGEPKVSQWQLFNLEKDPQEKHNLAGQHPEVVSVMHQRFLVQRRKDLNKER